MQSCWRSCGGSSDPVADYTNRDRQFAIACIALSCLGSVVVLLINYNSRRVLADELFMQVRFPSAVRIAPDKPVARLLDDAGQLKAMLDKKLTEVGVKTKEMTRRRTENHLDLGQSSSHNMRRLS